MMHNPMKKAATALLLLLFISGQFIVAFAVQEYWVQKQEEQESQTVQLQRTLVQEEEILNTEENRDEEEIQEVILPPQEDNHIQEDKEVLVATTVSRGNSDRLTSNEDLHWLSRIIHAEARGESFQGKVAVGNVVLNRMKTAGFPNTVKEVVFEYTNGIPQFSPVADGSIYLNPDEESIQAAREALSGVQPVGNATYFYNPTKVPSSWISRTKSYVTTIGDHAFYQ